MDEVALSQQAWEKIVSILGKPGHCKHVDKVAQSVVKNALKKEGITGTPFPKFVGNQAAQLCTTKLTPEGRTILILTAGAAATVYTVMNYDQVEDMVIEAARKARVPVKIPIPSQYGSLTAKIGFDATRAEWELKQRNAMRISAFYEQPYKGDDASYGLNMSKQLNGGSMNLSAGVNAAGQTSVMFRLQLRF